MSRIDKYDGMVGGFRARLNAAILAADAGKIQAVSISATGRVVIGGATLDLLRGLICPTAAMAAGDAIDVMTFGEYASVTETGGGAFAAGDLAYAHADGSVDNTAADGVIVGHMVELDRMVVRFTLTAAHIATLKLADLADVDTTGVADKAVLQYDAGGGAGAKWIDGSLALNDLNDVDTAGAADTNQLTYIAAAAAGSKWQPKTAAAGA